MRDETKKRGRRAGRENGCKNSMLDLRKLASLCPMPDVKFGASECQIVYVESKRYDLSNSDPLVTTARIPSTQPVLAPPRSRHLRN